MSYFLMQLVGFFFSLPSPSDRIYVLQAIYHVALSSFARVRKFLFKRWIIKALW